MQLKDSKGRIVLVNDKPLGSGGEGNVYKTKSLLYEDCCVKIFHPGKLLARKQKLDYMIKNQLNAPTNSLYRICWPIDFVYDGPEIVGYIMPIAIENSHSLYEINLKDGSQTLARASERGMTNRIKLLYNISYIIEILHKHGYLLVDFKLQNILFTDSGGLSIIDLDSIQIAADGKLLFEPTAVTAEYAYPNEWHLLKAQKPLTPFWDVYSFAIVAYQILLGIHPFTASTEVTGKNGESLTTPEQLMANNLFPYGVRATDIYAKPNIHNYFLQLPKDLRSLFINTFDLTKKPPLINKWRDTFKEIIENGGIQANMFRANPRIPIFILTSDIPTDAAGKQITISWETFYCDVLVVKGTDRTNVKKARIYIPQNGVIEVIASNHNFTYQYSFSFVGKKHEQITVKQIKHNADVIKQKELEAQRQAEIEKQRQAQRQAEIEKQRQAQRQAEIEKQRQAQNTNNDNDTEDTSEIITKVGCAALKLFFCWVVVSLFGCIKSGGVDAYFDTGNFVVGNITTFISWIYWIYKEGCKFRD